MVLNYPVEVVLNVHTRKLREGEVTFPKLLRREIGSKQKWHLLQEDSPFAVYT